MALAAWTGTTGWSRQSGDHIVLVVMMTGRLVQSKASLARAVLPLVLQLKWGWHRVERAMERGQVPLVIK